MSRAGDKNSSIFVSSAAHKIKQKSNSHFYISKFLGSISYGWFINHWGFYFPHTRCMDQELDHLFYVQNNFWWSKIHKMYLNFWLEMVKELVFRHVNSPSVEVNSKYSMKVRTAVSSIYCCSSTVSHQALGWQTLNTWGTTIKSWVTYQGLPEGLNVH